MANFLIALSIVLAHEGLYVDNIIDPGGATSYGISLRFLKGYAALSRENFTKADINDDGVIDPLDIKLMSKNEAAAFYKENFWDKYNYSNIADQALATKLFDLSVNMGAKQATVCLQRALRAVKGVKLLEDGILGPKTLALLNVNAEDYPKILSAFKSEAAGFYRLLAIEKPAMKIFVEGWLNRSYS